MLIINNLAQLISYTISTGSSVQSLGTNEWELPTPVIDVTPIHRPLGGGLRIECRQFLGLDRPILGSCGLNIF